MLSGMIMWGVGVMILSMPFILGVKMNSNFEKSSPFECGFDPKGSGYLNFSNRYFLIVIVFLIFDVEIAMLLPMLVIPLKSMYLVWSISISMFLFILVLGTLFEWLEGVFEWKN